MDSISSFISFLDIAKFIPPGFRFPVSGVFCLGVRWAFYKISASIEAFDIWPSSNDFS